MEINVQPSWTTRIINSSQLKSKQPYQRKINMKFITECVKEFNPNKIDPVHVSYRDGKYYVIDGQHTVIILETVNENKPVDIQCIVHKGMTYTDEADYYVDQYEKKHRHTFNEMTLASYEAGRKLPCELALEVSRVGGRLPYDKNTTTGMRINAVKKVEMLYKKDSDDTILAIKCLVEAYNGRESSLQGDIIAGTTEFLKLYGNNIVTSRLVNALAKYTPQTLTNTAKNLKMSYPINWTETLRDKYNEMSKRGKIKPIYSV
jgi:hypothetical protein